MNHIHQAVRVQSVLQLFMVHVTLPYFISVNILRRLSYSTNAMNRDLFAWFLQGIWILHASVLL